MKNKGFTMIELIVTIALLGVIVTISFVSINAVIKSNKEEQCNNLSRSIETAAKEYVSDNRYKKDVNLTSFTATNLNGYLSMPITNPYTKDEINSNNINITVTLDDNNNVISVNSGIICENGQLLFSDGGTDGLDEAPADRELYLK